MSRSAPTVAAPFAPRFALAWSALVYAVAAVSLGWPALAGKFLVNPASDQYKAGYAFREFAAHTLRTTGSFPQWDPYLFGGMPYVGAMHGDIFYPTFLLRMILPTDVAMTWSFILHVFLAGLFTYVLLRSLGFSFLSALVGGLAYMMGGPIAAYVSPGHDGKLYVSALLPLVLFLLVRGMRDGKKWTWGALSVTIGLAVLSPHPQLLQYLLLGSGAFALYLAFVSQDGVKLARPVALRRVGAAALAVALGFLMGAVQYLPVLQYVPWSPRSGGLGGYDGATQFSFPPEEMLNTYLPQFSGILQDYWGRNGIHLHSEYLGVVVLILAVLGLASGAVKEKRTNLTWFFIGLFVISTAWSLGGFTPFYRIVYWIVPGAKFFRAPSTMMFMMAFAVAVLAALGMERVEAGKVSRRFVIGWAIAAGLLAALGATGALGNMAQALAVQGRADFAIDNAPHIVMGSVRSFAAAALTHIVLLLVMRQRITPRIGAIALTALVALDLWSIERLYWQFSPPASVLFAGNAITDLIAKQDQPYRVLAVPVGPDAVPTDPIFGRDGLMPLRIRSVLGYHGNQLARYNLLLDENQGFRQIGNPQVWRLLNIKYFITNVTPSPITGAKQLLGPVTDAAGSPLYLYELPYPDPIAWVAPAIVKGADEAVLTTILDPRFDVGRAALFDTAAPVTGVPLTKLPDTLGITVRATTYEPGHIVLELSQPAPAGSALVVSENFYPGWTALADGKPAAIGRADYVLIGVALPTSARTVELAFSSPTYARGKTITLFALVLGLAWCAGGAVADKRSAGA